MKLRNVLAGAGVFVALAMAATGASATTYNLGGLTELGLSQNAVDAKGSVIDDVFNFSVGAGQAFSTYAQLIDFHAPFALSPTGTFSLFEVGNSTALTSSDIATAGTSSAGLTDTLTLLAGNYFVEVKGMAPTTAQVKYTLGIEAAAIPEPAAWAMMIAGLGMIGSTIRLRSRQQSAVA
jgi:hypothetical protein